MIKIGFIDYYLDEWHANNYPEFFKTRSNGRYEVCCAYGEIDSPIEGGMTNKQWSEKYNIPLANSIEEVIEKSDVLIVLSPDTPEMHEKLTKLPFESGKLTYVDKTFAPDRATAERIVDYAEKCGAKFFSSSALRFSSELKDIDKEKIYRIYSEGPGIYSVYSIHQIEPIVMLMNCRAKDVMFVGDEKHPAMLIRFEDGRIAQMVQRIYSDCPFKITTISEDNRASVHEIRSDYFQLFVDSAIEFFDNAVVPVPSKQTIDVIAIREAGFKAMETPFTWIEV